MIRYKTTYEGIAAYDKNARETAWALSGIKYSQWFGWRDHKVPAIMKEGEVILGDNGEFTRFYDLDSMPADFNVEKLEYWASNENDTPFFIYDKREIWKLSSVREGGKSGRTLCWFLERVPENTFLCECRDCGERYVVDYYESAWFLGRDMQIPSRCKPCRVKRRAG